ncbi:DEK, C-terminal [Cynara cardunculus var. scolymus]|uniref:DEK, C-terminal n=1 Tax=Cynara cardunculus var. scolymus TaxID=59895 RepID=A0A103XM18_CYNCS|nr:DEK, C-terminal [Cynara cardunculus var. scolymus]
MLTDSDLLKRLHDVLGTSDLDTATAATVRRRIEQDLGIDLSDRKPYIRQQIDLYLQSHYTNDKPEAEESEDAKHKKTPANAKKRGGGFSKPCALSPQLQKFVGEPEMARTEVVKKIWAYIKEKDLQNPQNRRKILCDEMLHEIFRVKSIDMFQMNKALTKHIWPIEEEDEAAASVKPTEKNKQNKRGKEDEPKEKGKRQKAKGSGFVSPHPISEALVQFFGTGENELSRAEVVKRMWEYIKQNDLQDPSDKRRILCDDKLRELFKVDTFIGFTVSKLLTAHFIKEE